MKRVTLKKREMSYAMTEELNTLRTNIQFSGVDKKVIVMTSSFSGEGKSTITYQLAKSLAELVKRGYEKISDGQYVGKRFCR